MKSLAYLILVGLKNRLLEVTRKPAKLILYILVIALIVGLLILSSFTRTETQSFLDLVYLKGIIFSLVLIFFIMSILKGLKSGDAIFDMNDVNFLFVSPLKPQSILLYGVIRMMGMSFWAGFFILFQGNSLGMWFGTQFKDLLLILGGFILALSLMQILSLIIYSTTNGRPRRKLFVKIITFMAFLPMIFVAVWQFATANGDLWGALQNLLHSPATSWTPIVGWTSQSVTAFISGNISTGLLFLGVIVVTGAALILYVMKSNPDYYEDVLVAAETAYEKKRAIAEGQIGTEAMSGKKVKVAATGIGGSGAASIFYKHLRESFRANRMGLWGIVSAITLLIAIFIAVLWRTTNDSDGVLLMILQVLMWMQLFVIGTGRGLKELYSHYIYMIPEPSFKKIVWSNLEVVFKVFVESVLIFGSAGIIAGEPPFIIILCIAVYTLFALLLIGINYFMLKITGANMSSGLLLFLYIIIVMIAMLPGIVAALVVSGMVGDGGVLVGLIILAFWELLVSVLCFALSKGILDRCDMPVMGTGK